MCVVAGSLAFVWEQSKVRWSRRPDWYGSLSDALVRGHDVGVGRIAASVAELVAIGGAGYNLQLEEPGSPTIKAQWLDFLGRWLDALATAGGKTLAIIIGGECRARDWMFMDCGDYRLFAANASMPRPNLRVITESTYEQEPAAWKGILANAVRGLGADLLQPGLEYGPPLDNPANGCHAAAKAANISTLYVWVNTPTTQSQWDSFGSWLAE